MHIEYGHDGQLQEVSNIATPCDTVFTFRCRETPRHEDKELPWVDVRIELLADETARIDYPNTADLRGATVPVYKRADETLIIDIGDSFVFHCRIRP